MIFLNDKPTDFDRRMRTAILAGGLIALTPLAPLAPLAQSNVRAADLNTNIVINPSFENVDEGDGGPFGSVRILDWLDADGDDDDTFAYNYAQDYAGVNTPASGGDFFFTGGFGTTAGQVLLTQTVDVTTGEAAAVINSGIAQYDLSAFFSGYLTQADSALVRARFLGVDDAELGTSFSVGGQAFRDTLGFTDGRPDWGQDTAAGAIPQGTLSIAVEILADVSTANHDGYADLIDLRVIRPDVLTLRINPDTGVSQLVNNSGASIEIDYYEILSDNDDLDPDNWDSLMNQDFEGGGAPQSPRVGDGWEEAGGSSSAVLSESFLQATSTIANKQAINLGEAIASNVDPDSLVFNFGTADGILFRGLVDVSAFVLGDLNGDGFFDAFDVAPFELALADKDEFALQFPDVDPDEVGDFNDDDVLDAFDVAPFEVGLAGGAAAAIPEPATLALIGLGGLMLTRRRKRP